MDKKVVVLNEVSHHFDFNQKVILANMIRELAFDKIIIIKCNKDPILIDAVGGKFVVVSDKEPDLKVRYTEDEQVSSVLSVKLDDLERIPQMIANLKETF